MAFGSILVLIVLSAAIVPSSARFSLFGSSTKVNKIFVFGDSTVDVGNNNYNADENVAKANFKPYGVDYPNYISTGRFSNGYNIIDYIAKKLGFEESPPAYLARGSMVTSMNSWFNGANFASGGSGVLYSTRSWLSMPEQIKLFKEYNANKIIKFVTNSRISKSLFVISTGSNDLFNFYTQKQEDTHILSQVSNNYVKYVANSYISHVEELYNLGARKFLILNVGKIGCCPFARMTQPDCNDKLNQLAQRTNVAIAAGMEELSIRFKMMKCSIGNTYEFMSNPTDPSSPEDGLDDVESACCKDEQQMCTLKEEICEDRSKYLFWDMTHGTQRAAEMAANSFFELNELNLVSPIDIKELVET